jgi:hypothetical protein
MRHAAIDLKFGSCTALSSSSLWLKYRNLLLSRLRVDLILHLCNWGVDVDGVRTILTTFYHMHRYNYAATGDMVKCFIIIIILLCCVSACTCADDHMVRGRHWQWLQEANVDKSYTIYSEELTTTTMYKPKLSRIVLTSITKWLNFKIKCYYSG